jgi:SAM-dependent methyltransferase
VDANLNLRVYSAPEVVDHYARAEGLFPAERYLFDKYIPAHSRVLDVGVGGGRTTAYLSARAERYLGVDYSAKMVEACRKRFPRLEFMVADATNLATIADDSFDCAVFAFNGIDYIPSDEARIACLRELRRVTRPGGCIIFSTHNARALTAYPDFTGAGLARRLWRVLRSVAQFVRNCFRVVPRRPFWRGSGYILDPVHGGLHTHVSSPASIARDAAEANLTVVEHAGHYHPARVPALLDPWTYYVLARAR